MLGQHTQEVGNESRWWLWWCPGGGGGALVPDVMHNSALKPNDPPDYKTADRYPTVVEGIRVTSVLMCGLGCAWTHTISEKMARDVLHLHSRTHTHTYTRAHTHAHAHNNSSS